MTPRGVKLASSEPQRSVGNYCGPLTSSRLSPDLRGGLNRSTQHLPRGWLQRPQKLKWFASADSNRTLPWLVLIDYSLPNRFSGRSTVVSID